METQAVRGRLKVPISRLTGLFLSTTGGALSLVIVGYRNNVTLFNISLKINRVVGQSRNRGASFDGARV